MKIKVLMRIPQRPLPQGRGECRGVVFAGRAGGKLSFYKHDLAGDGRGTLSGLFRNRHPRHVRAFTDGTRNRPGSVARPIIAGAVKKFWTDVIWGDDDYMFIDTPPGTGDVPLTVFQSIPVDGVVIVTSLQELVGMIERFDGSWLDELLYTITK